MSDSYSKEEADQSFIKETDFTNSVVKVLEESNSAGEKVEKIIDRYIRSRWHVLLGALVTSALALFGSMGFIIKAIQLLL